MAEDTGMFAQIMSHWKASMGDMVIAIEKQLQKKTSRKLSFWRVSPLIDQKSIDQDTLFLSHVLTGCDTTSAIHQKSRILDG